MKLANNVAIVTGSGTGAGAAIVRLFAKEGAAVTITGRRQEVLAHMVDAIAQSGGHAFAAPGSVTEEADVQRAVHTTLERFGRVDSLVNNAGSTSDGGVARGAVGEQG
jgi:NAD(P)-dependent dehydrogenase (short-subunit alcohol dehydrogenase family)